MVRCLAQLGADVNHADRLGETPLFWARDRDCCEALLKARADPRITSKPKAGKRGPGAHATAANIEHHARSLGPQRAEQIQVRTAYLKKVLSLFPPRLTTRQEYGHLLAEDGAYVVCLGRSEVDVDALTQLEQEFADDHIHLLDPGRTYDRRAWCDHLGIAGEEDHRKEVISSILAAGSLPGNQLSPDRRWTLVCYHYPSGEVVGYVHYALKEREHRSRDEDGQPAAKVPRASSSAPPHRYISIGYLKVAARHHQRGCGTLLMASVPKHLIRLAARLKSSDPNKYRTLGGLDPFARHISLSTVSGNTAAYPLYRKFGFQVDSEVGFGVRADENEEVSGRVPWRLMARNSQDTLQSLSQQWEAVVLRRALR